VKVTRVFGHVAEVDPFATGPTVAAEIQDVRDESGLAEPLRDVVVSARVLA
jgi:hypothetical protein